MRTIKTEFPDYDGALPFINGYEDTSWHNDACPSIEKDFGDDLRIRIWCDYANPENRERPESPRFAVQVYSETDEEGTVLLESDEFHEIIDFVTSLEASMKIPPLDLAREFCRQLHSQLGGDTMQLVNARNDYMEFEGDHSSCATHDFCDANMVMLDAIKAICGFTDYHFAQNEMINAAWDIARKARFDADKCCEPVRSPVTEILVLVYESTLTPRSSGYGDLMVYTNSDAANAAVAELAKIGVFVQAVPLMPIERFETVPMGTHQ
jgi:hypothetical protein